MAFEITQPSNPAMLDLAINEINNNLKTDLNWLTHAFGKSDRLVRSDEAGKNVFYAAVYSGAGTEYYDLTPNADKVNFSYFEVADPYNVETIANQSHIITANVSIVFWFNINTVQDQDNAGNLERIKQDILDIFMDNNTRYCRVTINQISEQFENVFKGYSYKNAREQYVMRPFAALKFTGEIRYEKLC